MAKKRTSPRRKPLPSVKPFLEDGYSAFNTEDSRCILVSRLLHLQADYIRALVNAGAIDHPADLAEAFASGLFIRLQQGR